MSGNEYCNKCGPYGGVLLKRRHRGGGGQFYFICTGRALDRLTKQKHWPHRQRMSKKLSENCVFSPSGQFFKHFSDIFSRHFSYILSTFPFSVDNFLTFFGHFLSTFFGHLSTFPFLDCPAICPLQYFMFAVLPFGPSESLGLWFIAGEQHLVGIWSHAAALSLASCYLRWRSYDTLQLLIPGSSWETVQSREQNPRADSYLQNDCKALVLGVLLPRPSVAKILSGDYPNYAKLP